MNFQQLRFFLLPLLLMTYSALKARQMWPTQKIKATVMVILLLILMLAGTFAYRLHPEIFSESWFQIMAWTSSMLMSLWATFVIFSLPVDILKSIYFFIAKKIPNSSFASKINPQRRQFITRTASLSILGLSGGLSGLGLMTIEKGPQVKTTLVPVKNLNPQLHGLRIAQISDLHIGPTIRKNYVQDVVIKTNATNPDLIFITGDLADAKVTMIAEELSALANLKSKYGVYFVTGNHEYYWEAEEIINKMNSFGFKTLLNENSIVEINQAKLLIAGVPDPAGEQHSKNHTPDFKKSIANSIDTDFKILLAHRPNACFEASTLGFDLQFSGHTHAGQFFPFNLFIGFAHKYYQGLNRYEQMWVYVNSGTGYWGPANRLTVPAEISLIQLTLV